MRTFLVCLCFLTVFLLQESVEADFDFRCNGALITKGETKPEVLAECGAPTFIDRPQSVIIDLGGILWPLDVDEEWIYNLGPQQFVRYVRFRDGRVIDIGHGKYGWTENDKPAN